MQKINISQKINSQKNAQKFFVNSAFFLRINQ